MKKDIWESLREHCAQKDLQRYDRQAPKRERENENNAERLIEMRRPR